MKKLLYYLIIAATFICVIMAGTFIIAALNTGGNFLMLIVLGAAISASGFVAGKLKERFNPSSETKDKVS